MPEGESQVGLVDVFNGNSNLRERTCACMRTGGRGLGDLANQEPLCLGKGCAELSVA